MTNSNNLATNTPSIRDIINSKIEKLTEKDRKKLEKENDPIKQLKISFKISKISHTVIMKEITNFSEKKWEIFLEEIQKPFTEEYSTVNTQIDRILFETAKDPQEYDNNKRIQSLTIKYNQDLIHVLDKIILSKKDLQRLAILLVLGQVKNELSNIQSNIEFNEFFRAANIVNNRLKFDHNWLTCLALIQLHENLIKKKTTQLNGQIRGGESISALMSQLVQLVKKHENRDISVELEMSQGLKKTRDLMTHEGYRHKVSKEALGKITKEIEKLDMLLYVTK